MSDRFIVTSETHPKWPKDHIITCNDFDNLRGYYTGQNAYRELNWWEHREWPLQVEHCGTKYTAIGYEETKDGFGLKVEGFTYPQHPQFFKEVEK